MHTIAGTKLTEGQYKVLQRLREHGLAPIPVGSYDQFKTNPMTKEQRAVGRLEAVVYEWIIDPKRARGCPHLDAARKLYRELWLSNYYALID